MADNTAPPGPLTPQPGAENTRLADTRWPGHMAIWNPIDATHGGFAFLASGLKRLIYVPLATASLAGAMAAADKVLVSQIGTIVAWAGAGANFAANWSDFGGGAATTGYRKQLDGKVALKGLAKKGIALALPDTIFTLPVGFRPSADRFFPAASNGGYTTIKISTGGLVQVFSGGSATWTSLDEIAFDPATT